MVQIGKINARTILCRSGLPGVEYVINPYVGCEHACVYCYAHFIQKYTGHKEAWGTFVDAKVNAPQLIPARPARYYGRKIYLSSVTDAYQPAEKESCLTRQILQKLVRLHPSLSIQTKSALVLRDLDLLRQFADCEVGFTFVTMDDGLRQKLEPQASALGDRLTALREVHRAGIPTFIFIGPIMPYLTDWKEIISTTQAFTTYYMLDSLNHRGPIKTNILRWLGIHFPQLLPDYRSIFADGAQYWQDLAQSIRRYCAANGLNYQIFF